MTSKRLETDAKIVLQNAGYKVKFRGYYLEVYKGSDLVESVRCSGGTVNNEKIEKLLLATRE